MVSRLSPEDAARSLAVWNRVREHEARRFRHTRRRFRPGSERVVVFPLLKRVSNVALVVDQCRHVLGEDWSMQVVCAPELLAWVERTLPGADDVDVTTIHDTRLVDLGRDDLFREPAFWDLIAGDVQLFVDHDTLICDPLPDEFLGYDFVAPLTGVDWVSPWCRFGEGGLSLRRRHAMSRICRTCNIKPWNLRSEGLMFSVLMRLEGDRYRLPGDDVAARFAVESEYHPAPFALHAAWKYLPYQRLAALLESRLGGGSPDIAP